ncbi:zinc ribbon domain-containing protein [Butyrivibrio sp. AC2005]|uniref:zinc ribbon domain-containing protein n=1 Tax=Butyrivibrio sp. AC2005 TaxID=1280672 RepID=UPI00041CC073|nr:zinc ribbon domain-containing protein [Butyrivibrio sp. AC2005]
MIIKMTCPKCGEEMTLDLTKGFSFCSNCGEKVFLGSSSETSQNSMPMSSQYQLGTTYGQHPGYYNATVQMAAVNPVLKSKALEFVSSPVALIYAILQGTLVILLLILAFYEHILWAMIFLMIPAIVATVEAWVTFGTAKWGKTGVKTEGITVGKVFSVIYMAITALFIFADVIGAIIWSAICSWAGSEVSKLLIYIFGTDFGAKDGQLFATNLGMVLFLVSLAPLIFWIVLQVLLNKCRDNLIKAFDGYSNSEIKTIFPAVLLFFYALSPLALGILLMSQKVYLLGGVTLLHAGIFAYAAVLLIMLENKLRK